MTAELLKSYGGVFCLRCREPIAVSAKVVRLLNESENRETNMPYTFVARCKLCEYESLYVISAVRTFEGEPRKRPNRFCSQRRRPPFRTQG